MGGSWVLPARAHHNSAAQDMAYWSKYVEMLREVQLVSILRLPHSICSFQSARAHHQWLTYLSEYVLCACTGRAGTLPPKGMLHNGWACRVHITQIPKNRNVQSMHVWNKID